MEDVISAQAFTNCASMHNLFSLKKYLTKKNVIRNIEIIKGLMRKTHILHNHTQPTHDKTTVYRE